MECHLHRHILFLSEIFISVVMLCSINIEPISNSKSDKDHKGILLVSINDELVSFEDHEREVYMEFKIKLVLKTPIIKDL